MIKVCRWHRGQFCNVERGRAYREAADAACVNTALLCSHTGFGRLLKEAYHMDLVCVSLFSTGNQHGVTYHASSLAAQIMPCVLQHHQPLMVAPTVAACKLLAATQLCFIVGQHVASKSQANSGTRCTATAVNSTTRSYSAIASCIDPLAAILKGASHHCFSTPAYLKAAACTTHCDVTAAARPPQPATTLCSIPAAEHP